MCLPEQVNISVRCRGTGQQHPIRSRPRQSQEPPSALGTVMAHRLRLVNDDQIRPPLVTPEPDRLVDRLVGHDDSARARQLLSSFRQISQSVHITARQNVLPAVRSELVLPHADGGERTDDHHPVNLPCLNPSIGIGDGSTGLAGTHVMPQEQGALSPEALHGFLLVRPEWKDGLELHYIFSPKYP